ncbi:MAG TPA: AsmA-like C-terminal domain-containing protein, partial [Devosia sp.]|nr:AsmA-like C-terminal domain-containing protein [Devosia sp.]
MGRTGRILLGLLCVLLAPLLALYITLLFTPIPLPFLRGQVQNAVTAWLSPDSKLELGDMALAVEGGTWPVLQFSPVSFTDAKTGGRIQMKALDVGFSPLRVLIGQPGAAITMVAPHLQVNQDLLGPRLANFEFVPGANGGPSTVRVMAGKDNFPSVGISAGGVSVKGSLPNGTTPGVRSDNDWLIYNMEAAEQSLGQIVTQAEQGRFSRLIVRDGVMEMNDAVYGVLRQFTGIDLDVSPGIDGKRSSGKFSANFAGQTMRGEVAREVADDGTVKLSADISNIDFSSFMPFINDPDSVMGIVGTGQLSIDVDFDGKTGRVEDGVFHTDLTGMDLRINGDRFPIASSIAAINWEPKSGQFKLDDAELKIGDSSATISGIFVLGLDDHYGPTAGVSITAKDVALQPGDMDAPAVNFDKVTFSGWSAPLYGALGIDSLEATKPGVEVKTQGRIDMLQKGLGFDLHVTGSGASADDVKRLWPYFLSTESRSWFVKNVKTGKVESADLHFAFPVGTLSTKGEDKPVPPNAISIDMVSSGVTVAALDTAPPVAIDGKTRLQVRDSKLTVSGDGAEVPTDAGPIQLATPAVVIDSSDPAQRVLELSGQVKSGIPSLVALVKAQQPQALDNAKLPLDVTGLAGNADVNLVSTITLDRQGGLKNFDYALNGSVANFASTAPIDGHAVKDGQISFTASQKGYQANGKANIDGFAADLQIDGTPDGQPNLLLSSTLDVKDLKGMGFDATNFLSGQVRFAARPMPDGTIQMDVDVKDAALDIKDLGIRKEKGVPGSLQAAVKQNGDLTELSQIKLAFGDVDLEGSLQFDNKKGLQSADFSTFALSPGDKAQASLTPIKDGYALQLHGEQLDLKPMLQHFFGLGGGTGGPQASQISQTIALNLDLKRVLGFYKTTAFNMQLQLQLKGSDIQKASLQTQFGDGKRVSVTTNPTPDGKVLSLAFNDLGTLLRFGGIYPRIEGGEGSLVMTSAKGQDGDHGTFDVHNFALVNEDNAAQILDSHADSRQLIAKENKLTFNSGHVDFIRSSDRVELSNGVLTGDTVGGTMHGFIYTDRRQYDLVGTYVPLFGLNNIFQKLPIFGPLIGGREGEGLIGVTFAVRGSLDKPTFQINPASLLVPG